MHRLAVPAVVLLFAAACAGGSAEPATPAQPELPPIGLAQVGDSVVYLERTNTRTQIMRPADTLSVEASHDAVIHVMRTAPDTLEAFYEYLRLHFETPTRARDIDTETMLGQRFVLHEQDGRIETLRTPEQPPELRQLTDLRRQFDDFFFRVPPTALALGTEWVDTVRASSAEGEATAERYAVTRYRVTGDTVVLDVPARVIEYTATVENRVRSAPSTQGVLTSTLAGEEEGTIVFSPEREVMLLRSRIGVLDGEVVVEGLETTRYPQRFGYSSTVELLPPAGWERPAPPVRGEPLPPVQRS